jgi:hypothetical protein
MCSYHPAREIVNTRSQHRLGYFGYDPKVVLCGKVYEKGRRKRGRGFKVELQPAFRFNRLQMPLIVGYHYQPFALQAIFVET